MLPNDIGVKVVYRNKDLEPTYSKVYTLREYTEMLRIDILRLVTDVEDLCFAANNNKPKEEWTDATFAGFNKIKHKLLDKAGEIGRVPENLTIKEPLSKYIARVLGEGEMPCGESCVGQDR